MSRIESPIERWDSLGMSLGIDLLVKRDDLLPFPLAGNKVRKLWAEAAESGWSAGDVVVTNGAVDSNHCRTTAMLAAKHGISAHLVLHGRPSDLEGLPTRILTALGATFEICTPDQINGRLSAAEERHANVGLRVHVVAGGAHTPAGVRAYADAGASALADVEGVTHIIVASGTGATQAGLAVAASRAQSPPDVIGVSVARTRARGAAAVHEAMEWVAPGSATSVEFDARFVDGGYARFSTNTLETVRHAWAHGLPLDTTYTGKAMTGLRALVREGRIQQGSRVLFWHTGGLFNQLHDRAWTVSSG